METKKMAYEIVQECNVRHAETQNLFLHNFCNKQLLNDEIFIDESAITPILPNSIDDAQNR